MLIDGVQLGADYGRDQVDHVLGVATKDAVSLVDWDLVADDARQWAEQHASDLIVGLNQTTGALLRSAIAEWIGNGLTLRDLLDELDPMFGRERARRIAVTETTAAYAQGNIAAWKRSGVITTMEWRTARDERVCPSCGPMDGQPIPVEGGDAPPRHVSCRCWLVPVVDEPKS